MWLQMMNIMFNQVVNNSKGVIYKMDFVGMVIPTINLIFCECARKLNYYIIDYVLLLLLR